MLLNQLFQFLSGNIGLEREPEPKERESGAGAGAENK